MRINEGGMIEIIRYRLPIYWACALINGDYSGLSEEEITNTLSFNWDSYEKKITQEEFDDFVKNVDRSKLPEGIKFELK